MEVYILYSRSLKQHYVGQTQDLLDRVKVHNAGHVKSSKRGSPWEIKWHIKCANRSEAMKLERRIKKRGASRFLEDIKYSRGVA
ncbi:MAG: excinuclease ABC subunit C [Crocinitomicaceae bacterium]|nr:excinuclease ABC subunit C [Crocinitomicaceae bacterium]